MKKQILTTIIALIAHFAYAQWQQTSCAYSNDDYVYCFATNGNNIFVGTDYGIYYSSNVGNSWITLNGGIQNKSITALLINGSKIFAGSDPDGLYVSLNNGSTWNIISNGIPIDIGIYDLEINGNMIFAGTDSGIFISTDNGISWSSSNTGLPSGASIYSILINGSTIFSIVSDEGVYKSTDNGNSWSTSNNGLPLNPYFFTSAKCGSDIFVAGDDGIFKSSNNGANWSSSNNGITSLDLQRFFVYNNLILIGSYGEGVFASLDNGSSWHTVNEGLSQDSTITSFGVSGNYIFGGTDGEGVWKRPFTEISGIELNTHKYGEFCIYPNPANDILNFKGSDLNNGNYEISLIDILGQQLQKVSMKIDNRKMELKFDTKGYSSGIYYLNIKSEKANKTYRVEKL